MLWFLSRGNTRKRCRPAHPTHTLGEVMGDEKWDGFFFANLHEQSAIHNKTSAVARVRSGVEFGFNCFGGYIPIKPWYTLHPVITGCCDFVVRFQKWK